MLQIILHCNPNRPSVYHSIYMELVRLYSLLTVALYVFFTNYQETETIQFPCEASVDSHFSDSFCQACRYLRLYYAEWGSVICIMRSGRYPPAFYNKAIARHSSTLVTKNTISPWQLAYSETISNISLNTLIYLLCMYL